MTHLRRELRRLKQYHEMAETGEIVRRYFAMNSFDGILTILGVLVGNYLAEVRDPRVVITTGLTTSVSMAISGLWGAYLTESAERQRSLDELENHTLSDLSETRLARASRVAVVTVAVVDGMAPLLASLLVLLPFFFLPLYQDVRNSYYLAVAIAMLALFALGTFLGRISKQNLFVAGMRMIVAGVVSLVLGYLLEGAIHR